MSTTHTIRIDVTSRAGSLAERSLIGKQVSFPIVEAAEDQLARVLLDAGQGEREISNNAASPARYVMILSRYLEQDDTLPEPVAPGDYAPFIYRLNGETVAQECSGLMVHTGPVQMLHVATAYATHPIELTVIFG